MLRIIATCGEKLHEKCKRWSVAHSLGPQAPFQSRHGPRFSRALFGNDLPPALQIPIRVTHPSHSVGPLLNLACVKMLWHLVDSPTHFTTSRLPTDGQLPEDGTCWQYRPRRLVLKLLAISSRPRDRPQCRK